MAKRLKYSVMNISAKWLNQIAIIVIRFANRAVFVRVLSQEYLGLSGLFAEVLALLSLAELGVGSAIAYHLYRPIAEQDEEKVAALMNLFRKVYNVIGVFVFAAGAALTPFLPYLIKEMPDIPHLSLIYLMFVLNSAVSYFFAYKTVLLNADQHGYIGQMVGIACNVVATVLQIVVLLATGNYILYLLITILYTLSFNMILSAMVDRRYPFLRTSRKVMPEKAEIKTIVQYTRVTMMQKLGYMMINSTDNLIISKFIGLAVGGMYSNYVLLSTCLNKIVGEMFNALTESVGNLGVSSTLEKQESIFNRMLFLNFWSYAYASTGLVCVSTPLVMLCFGRDFEMSSIIPMLIGVSFFCTGMHKTPGVFVASFGLLRHNRYAPLCEAAINLAVSIFLAQRIGLAGVIIGTIVSACCVSLWVEPMVLYHSHFHKRFAPYLFRLLGMMVLWVIECAISSYLCMLVQGPLFWQVVYRVVICTVVCNGVHFLLFAKTDAFQFYVGLLRNLWKQRMHKG